LPRARRNYSRGAGDCGRGFLPAECWPSGN